MRRKYPKPKVGDRYGKWTVLSVPSGSSHRMHLHCRCSCGREAEVGYGRLVAGRSCQCKMCGLKIARAAYPVQYGFVPLPQRRRMYNRVHSMMRRCYDAGHRNYVNYGGRGISVYPTWQKDPILFARYLMTLDGWDNLDLTLDRIDNDGNYEPGNLRFITRAENNRNKRWRTV